MQTFVGAKFANKWLVFTSANSGAGNTLGILWGKGHNMQGSEGAKVAFFLFSLFFYSVFSCFFLSPAVALIAYSKVTAVVDGTLENQK